MRRILGSVFLGTVLLAGCGRPTAEDYIARADDAERKARAIVDTLRDQSRLPEIFAPILENYRAVVELFPSSPHAARALFQIATIEQGALNQPEKAIETYKRYTAAYPESSKAEVAMFVVGYMYNNVLLNIDSARAAYTRFLTRYPKSELALSAEAELKSLGKTPEELLPAAEPLPPPPPPAKKPVAARKTPPMMRTH